MTIQLTRQIRSTIKSDADAHLAGFTRLVHAECTMMDGIYLIEPDADLDDVVQAWDTETYSFVKLNGWNWTFADEMEG
jgi:hypothetical protein